MQAVATAARGGIVERQPEVVAAEEPFERPARFGDPEDIVGRLVRLDARRHRGLRFDGLLVPKGAFFAARIKSVRTDGPERTGVRGLDLHEPAQRLQPELLHRQVVHATAAEDHRVRQFGVRVGNSVFEPMPFPGRGVVVTLDQLPREHVAELRHAPVAAQTPQVFIDPDERERPGAGRGELHRGRQRLLKQLRGQHLKTAMARLRDAQPKRPQRVTVTIFRTDLTQPTPFKIHEVAEATALVVEGMVQERRVRGRAFTDIRRPVAQSFQHQRQHQRARVVVCAIAFRKIRHGETGMLKNTRRIAHPEQVIELHHRQQLRRLFVERLDGRRLPPHETMVMPRLLERFHVQLRHPAPDHLAPQLVGVLAHRMTQGFVAQQSVHGDRDGRGIAERHEPAAILGQQFRRVPIRRRHHGVPRPERIRQRARRDLRFRQVGRKINIRRADEPHQFLQLDETVEEHDVFLHPQVFGQPLEPQAIRFAFIAQKIGMRLPEHDINDVGKFPDDVGERAQGELDAFVGRQQAEREQYLPAGDGKFIFEKVRVGERHVRDAVRDEIDLAVRHLEGLA